MMMVRRLTNGGDDVGEKTHQMVVMMTVRRFINGSDDDGEKTCLL
jgi:hypothetical protein